jgi:hypothetical protein
MATRKPRCAKRCGGAGSSRGTTSARKKSAAARIGGGTHEARIRKRSPETLRLRGVEPSITVSDLERLQTLEGASISPLVIHRDGVREARLPRS